MSYLNHKIEYEYNLDSRIESIWIIRSLEKTLKSEHINTKVIDNAILFRNISENKPHGMNRGIANWNVMRSGTITITQDDIHFNISWNVNIAYIIILSISLGFMIGTLIHYLGFELLQSIITSLFGMIIFYLIGMFRMKLRIKGINTRAVETI